ncbi:TNF receptor-associated factor 6 [Acropora cervicornis]|uniref:TNF receptor-associated factor 6 n=1 Tax=Acropora cervicornis TaxID=6130 RepID=A0AAD9QXU0_ACRCE|nr:TNF receptor-associated factor 6 [Acropora cervicornis]
MCSLAMSRSFRTEDNPSCFGGTSTNPVSGFRRNEPSSSFLEKLRCEGYDEYFDPPLENKYECPICLLGLREPCLETIVDFLNKQDAGSKCPVDNEHLDEWQECDFVHVLCPKDCGKEFQRKVLKKHLKDDCPNRTIPCSFCSEEVLWNRMETAVRDHDGTNGFEG